MSILISILLIINFTVHLALFILMYRASKQIHEDKPIVSSYAHAVQKAVDKKEQDKVKRREYARQYRARKQVKKTKK